MENEGLMYDSGSSAAAVLRDMIRIFRVLP